MNKVFKLGLIGGKDIKKYTIADILWKIINKYSDIKFQFEVISIENEDSLVEFFKDFKLTSNFLGFNVALPWKNTVLNYLDSFESSNKNFQLVNTVFKEDSKIDACNTDIFGIEKAHKSNYFRKELKILILGAGGAGFAVNEYLVSKYKNIKIFMYDISPKFKVINKRSIYLKNYKQIKKNKYDLIINATPLGKFNLNEQIKEFASPIDFQILKDISHNKTILQEMNYLPEKTLFLQMGEILNLKIIPGYYMLTIQALESLKKYFPKQKIKLELTNKILLEVSKKVNQIESEIYS